MREHDPDLEQIKEGFYEQWENEMKANKDDIMWFDGDDEIFARKIDFDKYLIKNA